MPISDEVRAEVASKISQVKASLSGHEDFPEDQDMRSIYVILLTIEGVVVFGDESEFSEVCLAYCARKEKGESADGGGLMLSSLGPL